MVQTTSFPTITTPIDTYPDALQRLIRLLQPTTDFTPGQIKDAVKTAQISAQDLMPWADFDHPVADSYGRKLVYYGGHFEIMVMSWVPGDFSAIHDHGATQWGAVQCFGSAKHYIYSLARGILRTSGLAHYTPGMVHAVDHSLIHQMGNDGSEPFLSLHVYGCNRHETSITGNARIFDLFDNSIQYTDGGVFFCLPEDQINHRQVGLVADPETILRHHRQMCDRIRCILTTQPNADLAQRLRLLERQIQRLT